MNVPTPEQLYTLKTRLEYPGWQMAELAGYASKTEDERKRKMDLNTKWRKLTIPAEKKGSRSISPQAFFCIAANLALSPNELEKITDKMAEILAS